MLLSCVWQWFGYPYRDHKKQRFKDIANLLWSILPTCFDARNLNEMQEQLVSHSQRCIGKVFLLQYTRLPAFQNT